MEPVIPNYINVLFIALTVTLFGLIVYGVNSTIKRKNNASTSNRITFIVALGLFAWLVFLKVISGLNILDQWNSMPPRLLIALLPPLITTIIIASSVKFRDFLQYVPQRWMVLIQSFRIVMEIILLMLFIENIIPQQMSFEGRNFDILSGITALIVGYLVVKNKISRKLLIAWNLFGLILLANIVTIAILSTPLPIRLFMNEPADTVIAYFPFVWLPGFVVPVAYFMHVVSIKKALSYKTADATVLKEA